MEFSAIDKIIVESGDERWIFKKKISVLKFCQGYLDFHGEPPVPKSKKPKSILKNPGPRKVLRKKASSPVSSVETEEESEIEGSFELSEGSSEEKKPHKKKSRKSNKKPKEMKPGYAKLGVNYKPSNSKDVMSEAKKMARKAGFEN